jgi:phospholipid-translocating ATPase
MALLAAACGVAESTLEKRLSPLGAPWFYNDIYSDDNPRINGLITFIYAILT